ncbi:MAG: preprotein translocase subunit SecA [Proteobacteria bacterium]|nr:MAG: preprotein translocase subunit SecA [Pseudomonadota bacterium]
MFKYILDKIIGSKNQRDIKKMQPIINAIGEQEEALKKLSDAQLQAKTPEFKQRLENGESVDDLLIDAFALVRETGRRRLGMRHYDVQLVGGIVLHRGIIAEMKTGEGKTLVATLPLYLNALRGKGCHLVTVNDYLAKRDAEWMGQIYQFLGLSVGVIYHDIGDWERQQAYRADITYGQNNEFGFDYLRDNMKDSIEQYAQRPLHYAIVDEVDSILIDEARTPLIISGPAEQGVDLYHRVNAIIPSLKKDVDYTVDEKAHSSMLTDSGVEAVEKKLGLKNLYDPANIHWLHNVQQSLSAHTLYKRDVNYMVREGKVLIIDEHTGREMEGRRWSDGLHQAVEAKENVTIEEENQTLATITFQNYFRMYEKLAGMTGTAETEAEEFFKIYKLEVMVIPTNKPIARADHQDVVYKTEAGKFRHVIEEILDCNKRGQPVLVGTTSVEKSELLAKMLRKRGIKHNVLNAKQHMREATVVAQAGRKGALTISTNMAGRGTDIVLGGNPEALAKTKFDPESEPEAFQEEVERLTPECKKEREEVLAAGGLHILGTERHESRRIDNQLRGRSGRQGDPGSSRFYLSLEDDLLRIFGSDRISGLMERLGMSDDEPIEHRFVTKAIGNAQKKVEGHNFDIRKHLLEYDDVMNQQRKTIYALRREVLEGRYAPDAGELTEAERKAGKKPEPPKESGKWTIESLSDQLRPKIKEVVEAHAERAAVAAGKPEDDAAQPHEENASLATFDAELDHRALTHDLYRYFGAVVELERERRSPKDCIVKATEEVAASLIQQRERVLDVADALIGEAVSLYCDENTHSEDWDIGALEESLSNTFNVKIDLMGVEQAQQALASKAYKQVETVIEAREEELGPIYFLYFSRHFLLEEIDNQWIEHLRNMDHLREGIGLRGYGQRDPKQEYKKEGFSMFAEMMDRIYANAVDKLFKVQLAQEEEDALPTRYQRKKRKMSLGRGSIQPMGGGEEGEEEVEIAKTVRRDRPKIGRNDPCWCGSGKKYKRCHMRADQESGSGYQAN